MLASGRGWTGRRWTTEPAPRGQPARAGVDRQAAERGREARERWVERGWRAERPIPQHVAIGRRCKPQDVVVLALTRPARSRYSSGLAHRCQEPRIDPFGHPNPSPEQEPSISERRDSEMAERTTRDEARAGLRGAGRDRGRREPGEPGDSPDAGEERTTMARATAAPSRSWQEDEDDGHERRQGGAAKAAGKAASATAHERQGASASWAARGAPASTGVDAGRQPRSRA